MATSILVNNRRRDYQVPSIERFKLDNEISLTLDSLNTLPPTGPDESKNEMNPDSFNNDPFRNKA